MHRDYLLRLLNQYNPHIEQEIEHKDRIIAFVQDNENCFERELETGHITSSSWLLNKDASHAMLLHHKKLDKWFQPGGHADGDSNILAVAIKEAQEESGIQSIEHVSEEIFDVDVHLIPANSKDKEHFHYDIRFLLQVKSDEELQVSEESRELRWISKNKEDLLTDEPSVTRMFYKWIS